MTDLTLNHFTSTYLRSERLTVHSVDIRKIRETFLIHATDALKVKPPTHLTHTTDTRLSLAGLMAHTAFATKYHLPTPYHFTDAYKRSPLGGGIGGEQTSEAVLAGSTEAGLRLEPEFSRNSSTYLGVGDGLSILMGLPRVPTWNTPGRPQKPKAGTYGFNTQTRALEVWDGKIWQIMLMDPV